MGTSGAYGGSAGARWRRARDLLGDTAADAPGGGADSADGDVRPTDHDLLDDLGQAIGQALTGDDPDLGRPAPSPAAFPLPDILPRRPQGGGGGGGGVGTAGSGARGTTGAAGRAGGGSRRRVLRGAARGGAALGSAYALRRGDAAALREFGLNLDDLRGLSPRMQCARILDAVLGDAGHPDEYALRQAAAEQVKAIILAETPPSEADSIRGFIASYVFQLCIVELRSALASGGLDAPSAARKEGRIRDWIARRVRKVQVPAQLAIDAFRSTAARVAHEAIRILRAGA